MSRISVDIGGTFTDAVFIDDKGVVHHGKGFTSHGSYGRGVLEAIQSLGVDVSGAEVFPHGTTVALNAIIEGKTAPTALITTEGFRDVLEIARYHRENLYDLMEQKARPLVPRSLRLEVRERIAYDGTVLQPLDPSEVRERLRSIRDAGIRNVAVCFVHGYLHTRHERLVGEIARAEFPELTVSLSCEVSPQWREYERTVTTVLNVSTASTVKEYLDSLAAGSASIGLRAPILVMQSNGGVMSSDDAKVRPITTLMSGPVGGVIGACRVATQLGIGKLLTFDVGGTSADIALIIDSEPETTSQSRIESWPLLCNSVAIHSVGAGGGSKIRASAGGGFRVGPESAGSIPGPICYGRGGMEPTVTDANLCLGRIDPEYFLGGTHTLQVEAARAGFRQHVLPHIGGSVEDAAAGALKVINTVMARAIREITVGHGYDPSDFALLSFGGAGSLHAASVAEELGVAKVVVPYLPGHFSALGILGADLRHDFTRMVLVRAQQAKPGVLTDIYATLREEGRCKLASENVADDRMQFKFYAEARYAGQEETLSVPVQVPLQDTDAITSDFTAIYVHTYGYDLPNDIEILSLRVTAIGRAFDALPALAAGEDGASARTRRRRKVYVDSLSAFEDCEFVDRRALPPGETVQGPAIIEEHASTTYVPPRWSASIHPSGHLILVKA